MLTTKSQLYACSNTRCCCHWENVSSILKIVKWNEWREIHTQTLTSTNDYFQFTCATKHCGDNSVDFALSHDHISTLQMYSTMKNIRYAIILMAVFHPSLLWLWWLQSFLLLLQLLFRLLVFLFLSSRLHPCVDVSVCVFFIQHSSRA